MHTFLYEHTFVPTGPWGLLLLAVLLAIFLLGLADILARSQAASARSAGAGRRTSQRQRGGRAGRPPGSSRRCGPCPGRYA